MTGDQLLIGKDGCMERGQIEDENDDEDDSDCNYPSPSDLCLLRVNVSTFQRLIQWLIAPYHDEPRASRVALPANHRHSFACRSESPLYNFAVFKSRYPPTVSIGQVNFNRPLIAQADVSGVAGTNGHLLALNLPVIPPIERGVQMAGDFDADRATVRLRRVVLVGGANELDVKSVGLVLGRRRSV